MQIHESWRRTDCGAADMCRHMKSPLQESLRNATEATLKSSHSDVMAGLILMMKLVEGMDEDNIKERLGHFDGEYLCGLVAYASIGLQQSYMRATETVQLEEQHESTADGSG